MNDLVRPTLYDAHHDILPVRAAGAARGAYDPRRRGRPGLRERRLSRLDRDIAEVQHGDLIAVMSAGAYGAVQASTYNSRLLIPEVLVKGARLRSHQIATDIRGIDCPRHNSALVGVRLSSAASDRAKRGEGRTEA